MNAMPPDVALPRRGLARAHGWPGSRRRRRGCSTGCATSATARTGDRARSPPTTTRSRSPILHVGGWMDSYVDAAFRMQARCTAPSRTIVGNWVHGCRRRGHRARTSTSSTRWSASSIAGCRASRNGADDEPPDRLVRTRLRARRSRSRRPAGSLAGRRARSRIRRSTRASGRSPPARCRWPGGSRPTAAGSGRRRPLPPPADAGTRGALSWGAGGAPNGLARDLRPDEAFGPTYTSAPLDEPLSILGVPEVVLHLAVSAPVATAVVRLADVAPDGTSAQVSAGILNLTHRRSHRTPSRSSPGRVEEIRVQLRADGLSLRAGPPDPRLGRVLGLAGRLAVAVPRRASSCTAEPRPRRDSILPVVPPAGGPGDLPPPAFKIDAAGRRRTSRWRIVPTPPVWRDPRRRHRRQRHGHVPRRRRATRSTTGAACTRRRRSG